MISTLLALGTPFFRAMSLPDLLSGQGRQQPMSPFDLLSGALHGGLHGGGMQMQMHGGMGGGMMGGGMLQPSVRVFRIGGDGDDEAEGGGSPMAAPFFPRLSGSAPTMIVRRMVLPVDNEEGDGDAAGVDKDDEDAPPRHPLLKMLLERNARNDDADEDDEGDGRTKAVKVPLKVTAAPSAAGGGGAPRFTFHAAHDAEAGGAVPPHVSRLAKLMDAFGLPHLNPRQKPIHHEEEAAARRVGNAMAELRQRIHRLLVERQPARIAALSGDVRDLTAHLYSLRNAPNSTLPARFASKVDHFVVEIAHGLRQVQHTLHLATHPDHYEVVGNFSGVARGSLKVQVLDGRLTVRVADEPVLGALGGAFAFGTPAAAALALGLNGSASLTANHTAGLMLPHDASTAGMKSHLQGGELTVAIPRVLPVDVAIE